MLYRPRLVRAVVCHFLDLAGWEGERVTLTFSRARYDRAARRFGVQGIADDDAAATLVRDRHGSAPERWPVIWVDPGLRDFRRLARTLAHEALHATHPSMPHGRAFERGVTRLLRGEEPGV